MSDKPKYAVGDRVTVVWFDGPTEAIIARVSRYGGNGQLFAVPYYGVTIEGVAGTPSYREDEMEAA